MIGVEQQQTAFDGEIICDAVFWNLSTMKEDWYTPMIKWEGLVMIRLKQVLITCTTMKGISDNNILPNKCKKKHAANQEVMKIEDDICEIIEKVYRRDKFDK